MQTPITSLETLHERYPEIDEICFKAAHLLLAADIPRPLQMARAYFSTIELLWPDISIEVSDVDYEYYDVGPGKTDIRHYPHAGGTSLTDELLNLVRANGATKAGS